MKHILQYSALVILSWLMTFSEGYAQNSGFIDAANDRYKWDISGNINPPQTEIRTIYPSPSRDKVEVQLEDMAYQPVHVWLLNMDGTVVKTFHFQPQGNLLVLDVSNVPKGEYALHIREDGKQVQRMLLVLAD